MSSPDFINARQVDLFDEPVPGATASRPRQQAQQRRCVVAGAQAVDYVLVRSRRRTIGFLVNSEGLRVTAPKWSTLADIERAIREKQRWILSKLMLHRERAGLRQRQRIEWRDGAVFPFLDGELTLRCRTEAAGRIELNADTRELWLDMPDGLPENQQEAHAKEQVKLWLQQEAKSLFGRRLPVYAERLGVSYQSYALSSAGGLWGSCTSRGRIRLNWRLIHFAPDVIDYVVAHELAHLHEMNHSERFWQWVASVYPEHLQARRTLRELGPRILQLF